MSVDSVLLSVMYIYIYFVYKLSDTIRINNSSLMHKYHSEIFEVTHYSYVKVNRDGSAVSY